MRAVAITIEKIRDKWTNDSGTPLGGFKWMGLTAIVALLSFAAGQYFHSKPSHKTPVVNQVENCCPPPKVIDYNMTEFKYTRPLLLVDIVNLGEANSGSLKDIENGINSIIEQKKLTAGLTDASVYFRQLNTDRYLMINSEERFHPASLAKVAVMIVYLKESELHPGLLNKKILFPGNLPQIKQIFPPDEVMKPGKEYTIKELIYRTVVKSDNDANMLLTGNLDIDLWNKLFAELQLPVPELSNMNYTLNVNEYSRFMRMLYNASYLNNEDADYALSLLVDAKFKDGIKKQLPADVTIANKFGEYGQNDESGKPLTRELHEFAIIYIANNPILVTIMTRGKDEKQLASALSDIGKYIYEQAKNKVN